MYFYFAFLVFMIICQIACATILEYQLAVLDVQGVPKYMTQFQNFIKNKQVKIQRKLKIFSERL